VQVIAQPMPTARQQPCPLRSQHRHQPLRLLLQPRHPLRPETQIHHHQGPDDRHLLPRSGPGKPIFVNVGDDMKPGKTICIIEAMKLFNEIESEVTGKIVKVLVDDAKPVEYDQPLFLVDPS
jgi:acetyl/propionyl-CoA carboxylase alpha subunit